MTTQIESISTMNGDITSQGVTTESPIEHTHVSFPDFDKATEVMADDEAQAAATSAAEEAAAMNGGAVQETEDPPIKLLKERKRTFSYIESDEEYEYWRIPKGHPKVRDPTEVPLKAYKATDNKPCTMWAKLDTGADVNVVAIKTVERLGLEDAIYPSSSGPEDMYVSSGNKFTASRCVKMSFEAGRSSLKKADVEFWIPDTHEGDTDTDGLPDVLLGWPFIKESHMVMVDPEFIYEPDAKLEVLAKRTEDELLGDELPRKKIMPTKVKHPQVTSSKYGR